LPGVLSKAPGPQHLSLPVTDYDTNIRAVAIIIDHRTTSKAKIEWSDCFTLLTGGKPLDSGPQAE